MRRFLTRRIPPFTRVLLVESGSRNLLERIIPYIYSVSPSAEIDVVTCYSGAPAGLREGSNVFRTADYPDGAPRAALVKHLNSREFAVIGIICSGEPIMTKWKWWLAAKVPAKLLVLNENADWFWVDRGNWRVVLHFMFFRAGLTGKGGAPAIARLLVFPFTLLYLLAFAGWVHFRRAIRLLAR